MNKNNAGAVAGGGGVGFPALLTLLFIGLKLTGYIDWTWLWVLSPMWISFLAFVAVCVLLVLVALIGALRSR